MITRYAEANMVRAKAFSKLVLKVLGPENVSLIAVGGSTARGDAGPDSDIDFVIVRNVDCLGKGYKNVDEVAKKCRTVYELLHNPAYEKIAPEGNFCEFDDSGNFCDRRAWQLRERRKAGQSD